MYICWLSRIWEIFCKYIYKDRERKACKHDRDKANHVTKGPKWSVVDVHCSPAIFFLFLSPFHPNPLFLTTFILSYFSVQKDTPKPPIFFFFHQMRKLCPNYDLPDGLETVLEVPIPEEMFVSNKTSNHRSWQNMKSWMNLKPNTEQQRPSIVAVFGGRNTEIQLLLGVIGAPLIPLPINHNDHFITKNIKDHPIVRIFMNFNITKSKSCLFF